MKFGIGSKILVLLSLFFLVNGGPLCFAETKKETARGVQLNLADVELSALARFVSETTGKNFIFDERLKGKVTVITPSNLSSADSYNLFVSVLELKGFTVIPTGVNAYKIVPAAEAKQRGIRIDSDKTVNDSYIARLIPLKYISSDDALKFLQPLVSKDGHISTFGPGNLLFMVDSGLNIEKILKILEDIDRQSTKEDPEIVFLKHSSADIVAKIINEGISRKAVRTVPQAPAAEEAKAVADTRLNAVVLFGDRTVKESMKSLIALVDVPSKEAQGRINVYFLENADAMEVAKVLEGIIRSVQPQRQAVGTAPVTPFEAVGGISVTPDKFTNSLVIVASPADYLNISQVLKQLDIRRRQVFVEAMIAEVSMDKLLELGSKWRGTVLKDGRPVFIGGIGEINQETIGDIITGLSGLTVGGLARFFEVQQSFLDPSKTGTFTAPGLAAIFSLSDFKGVVNVLSTPQILTSDNREAEIIVGSNVPFISKRERDITTTNTVLSSVERQDVGVKLKITPQITEGDYVKLDIYQEISALTQESETILINVGPTITKRSTKTSVVVKDKQTVVIGGLIQDRDEENVTKVPVLGDIPLLGYLFKSRSVSKTKTNLLVFLTPHVVKEAESLARITKDKEMEYARMERLYAQGELLIKFRTSVPEDKALQLIRDSGASVIKFNEGIKVYHIKLRDGQSVEDAVKDFSGLPEVEYSEPNYKIKLR